MKNNPYLFYRLALCYIEQEFQKNEKNFKKNNENDIVNKTIFDETSEEASFRKRFILVNQSLSPSITNTDENKENQDETESISRLNFVEAIRYLKECILIIKGYNSFNEQIYTTLKPLMNISIYRFLVLL